MKDEKFRIISNIGVLEEIIKPNKLRTFLGLEQVRNPRPEMWCEVMLIEEWQTTGLENRGIIRGYQGVHLKREPAMVEPTFTFYLSKDDPVTFKQTLSGEGIFQVGKVRYKLSQRDPEKPVVCESLKFSDWNDAWAYMRKLVLPNEFPVTNIPPFYIPAGSN